MALYLISYDISEKDAFEYDGLWQALKDLGANRILYSEWVINGNTGTARQIYDKIAQHTQAKDGLLVQEVTKDAVWDKLKIDDNAFREWLGEARG